MLYNFAKYKGYDVSVGEDMNILSYNDALSVSDYAYAALQWACGAGILNGDTNGNLNPRSSATRAEVAAMLKRFMEKMVG
ncbi:MAG: S-layer homology domain-containing protein [Bacillota bacterium]